jgi:cytochrome b561
MTSFYLALALIIALALNQRRPLVRALGAATAGLALCFMAGSIALAWTDGTFAAASRSRTPLWLTLEAVVLVAIAGVAFWSVPRQLRAAASEPLPLRGTKAAYGQVTRALHWTSAVLIFAAFTMGQFVTVLSPAVPEHAMFLATHLAIGGAIFLLTFGRLIERLLRPSPPTPGRVKLAHAAGYALIIATCVSGLAMVDAPVDLYGLKLPNLPSDPLAETMHRGRLPLLFGLFILAHLAGATRAIGRMVR